MKNEIINEGNFPTPHVLITIPCLLLGGTEMQTLNLVQALKSNGFQVTVCCYHEWDIRMEQAFVDAGADVVLMHLERSQGLGVLIRHLMKLFKTLGPDMVHVQYMAPGFAPVVAARLARVKTVFATVHQPGRVHGVKARMLLRMAARLCSCFFCVSRAAETSWFGSSRLFDPVQGVDRGRMHYTIYNAVDTAGIQSVVAATDRRRLKDKLGLAGCPVIGVVGRLREEKGQSVIIRAMPKIVKAIPKARLLIIGDGPDRERLQDMAADMGIQDGIYWMGEKDPSEVLPYYSIMDVAAVPSRFEGFGLVAAEAMAAGVPVVASGIDGLNEVISHGKTGYLIPESDSAALADAVVTLLSDPTLARAMGEAGRKITDERFSRKQFTESMNAVYRHFMT